MNYHSIHPLPWPDVAATPIADLSKLRELTMKENGSKSDPAEQKKFAARFRYINPDAPASVPPRFEFDGREITEKGFFCECFRAGFDAQIIVDLIQAK